MEERGTCIVSIVGTRCFWQTVFIDSSMERGAGDCKKFIIL